MLSIYNFSPREIETVEDKILFVYTSLIDIYNDLNKNELYNEFIKHKVITTVIPRCYDPKNPNGAWTEVLKSVKLSYGEALIVFEKELFEGHVMFAVCSRL